ncbi:hypothetical protein EP7_002251 [Isosphaeraceae bacterium EP7]
MRHRTSRPLRGAPFLAACALAASAGCTHNHYYTALPVCGQPAALASATMSEGSLCDPAGEVVNAPVSSSVVGRPVIVTVPPRTSRVIISEPTAAPAGRGGSKLSWRRNNPDESLATTRIDGNLDDDSVRK